MNARSHIPGALALACALGSTYPRDKQGYEYVPAPRSRKPNPSRRTGSFTRSGGPANKRSHQRYSFEMSVARAARTMYVGGVVPAAASPCRESWEHFIDRRVGKMDPHSAAMEWVGV